LSSSAKKNLQGVSLQEVVKVSAIKKRDLIICSGTERRKSKADGKNDREPDQPHGRLGGGR